MSNDFFGLSFDVADAVGQATFWAKATGGEVANGATQDDAVVTGSDFPLLAFHRVREDKSAKNRLHIDLVAPEYEAEIERLLGLGAIKVNELAAGGARWTTLIDPEGNEFDVIAG